MDFITINKTWIAFNTLKLLDKSVLIPLELTAAASAKDAATIPNGIFGSGTTTLIICNE